LEQLAREKRRRLFLRLGDGGANGREKAVNGEREKSVRKEKTARQAFEPHKIAGKIKQRKKVRREKFKKGKGRKKKTRLVEEGGSLTQKENFREKGGPCENGSSCLEYTRLKKEGDQRTRGGMRYSKKKGNLDGKGIKSLKRSVMRGRIG